MVQSLIYYTCTVLFKCNIAFRTLAKFQVINKFPIKWAWHSSCLRVFLIFLSGWTLTECVPHPLNFKSLGTLQVRCYIWAVLYICTLLCVCVCVRARMCMYVYVCLYSKTGLGRCAPKHSEALSSIVANMHKYGLPVSVLDSKQMKERCPHLILPDNFECVYEEDAGILAGSKAVTALQVSLANMWYP